MNSRIIYTPQESKKRKWPSRKAIFVVSISLLVILLLGGSVYILHLPYWRIKNMEISGLEALSDKDIKAKVSQILEGKYLFFIPRDSIITMRTKFLAEELKKEFPKIEEITIVKNFPSTLKISLAERKLFGIFCGISQCAYIDKKGFAYEEAPDSSGSLIVKIKSDAGEVKINSQAVEAGLMEKIIFLGEELKRTIGAAAVGYEISFRVPREIKVETNEGFKIIFNREDNFQNIFKVLKTILNEEIKDKRVNLDYIDLRFGNKAFYKFKK